MQSKHRQTNTSEKIAIVYHQMELQKFSRGLDKKRRYVDGDTGHIVQSIARALRICRYRTKTIGITDRNLHPLKNIHADFVFNLVDSRKMELKVAKMLERMHIPYSGSKADALRTSNNKVRSKRLFCKYRIPTPRFTVLPKDLSLSHITVPSSYPLIVKPAFDHCSVGITDASVVTSRAALYRRVRFLHKRFAQSLLLEEFIPGKEIHILVVETGGSIGAYPPSEMIFSNGIRTRWNIYGFGEKWNEKGRTYQHLYFRSPVSDVPDNVLRNMRRDALRAFFALDYRDYARFDVRYNPKIQKYYFLEGNANPGMSTDSDDAFMASLRANNKTFRSFLSSMVKNGLHGAV